MSLSCSCEYYPEAGSVMWEWPTDYTPLNTKRSRNCCSCGDKIATGSLVAAFHRYKVPEYQIEINLYGEDGDQGPHRATQYHCERCADLMFSLLDLGFECISIYDDMRGLGKEYANIYGPVDKRTRPVI